MGTNDLSLNPNIRSAETVEFQKALRAKIVGQDEAVQALVELFQVFTAGLNSPGRPVSNLLFLGPTGSGKTRIVEAAAEILFVRWYTSSFVRPALWSSGARATLRSRRSAASCLAAKPVTVGACMAASHPSQF